MKKDLLFRIVVVFSFVFVAIQAKAQYQISGPDLVCPYNTATFTIQAGGASVYWYTTSSTLTIQSGQGTNSVTVKSDGLMNYVDLGVSVTSGGQTLYQGTKRIRTNTPYVEQITGSTSVNVGQAGSFTASPSFPESMCDYEWIVGGNASGYTITYQRREFLSVVFSQTGTYTVLCRTTNNPCTASQSPERITVSVGARYSVQSSNSNVISVRENAGFEKQNTPVACALYESQTGILVLQKNIQSAGGEIDATSVPKGMYVLKLKSGDQPSETHKIMLK